LAADPLAPAGSVLLARVLRYSGADVGEVVGYIDDAGTRQPGMIARDIDDERSVPTIRFKRQKVTKSVERDVPLARRWADDLKAHIAHYRLRRSQEVFAMVDRGLFERAHERAVRSIERPDINLKDLRHFAAQSWAAAGARLEHMKVWLGHSSITQTMIYSRFLPEDSQVASIVDAGANPRHPPEAAPQAAPVP